MAKQTRKSCVVGVRVTAAQHAQLTEDASRNQRKLSAHLRAVVLSRTPVFREPTVDTTRLLQVYEKIGQDMNRVAHQVNLGFWHGVLSEKKFKGWINSLASVSALAASVEIALSLPKGSAPPATEGVPEALKTQPINFRLFADELEPFGPLIAKSGGSASVFFRELIFNASPLFITAPVNKRRLIFIGNKTSNNITQLSYRIEAAFHRGIVREGLYEKWLYLLAIIETFMIAGIAYGD